MQRNDCEHTERRAAAESYSRAGRTPGTSELRQNHKAGTERRFSPARQSGPAASVSEFPGKPGKSRGTRGLTREGLVAYSGGKQTDRSRVTHKLQQACLRAVGLAQN